MNYSNDLNFSNLNLCLSKGKGKAIDKAGAEADYLSAIQPIDNRRYARSAGW
jgi:hypothetical protein